jgi:hypothetical protein
VSGNANSQFGYAVSSSFDGAQLAVGAPNDSVVGAANILLPGAGSVWVYDRVIEAFNSTGSTDFVTKNNIAAVYKVTIDGVEVNNYRVIGTNTIRFITPPALGHIIFVEVNQFNLLEKLIGIDSLTGGLTAIQANAAFGTSLTICSNNCAIYVGAPNYNAGTEYNSGAVWKFHNRGRLYGTNTGYAVNPKFIPGDSIRLNNFEVIVANVTTGNTQVASLDDLVSNINSAGILGVTAVNQAGRLRLNSDVTVAKDQLRIVSGIKSAGSSGVYTAADLRIFAFMQIIVNPYHAAGEYFGSKVKLASNAYMLVIGSGQGTTKAFTTFDKDLTTFDVKTTRLFDKIPSSGSVYIYELYDDPRNAVEHPGRYAFCQQIDPGTLMPGAKFGYSLDIELPYIIVSAPGDSSNAANSGAVYVFQNPTLKRGWELIRYQQPTVDIDSVSRIYLYSNQTNTILDSLQYIDPAKGRILGQAEQEISYKTAYDPAQYNRGTNAAADINTNVYWGTDQVGKVWWNLTKVRYIDYEQDTLTYRSKNWGQLFPGATIEVLEWVESSVLPNQYVRAGGDGVPKYADNSAYVEIIHVDPTTNIIGSKYYFWVANKTTVDPNNVTRTIPISAIADYIANPKGQGIAYAAIIQTNAVALYNIGRYLSANNTILHLDYDLLLNTNIIHSEYELLQKGNPNAALPTKIVNKLIDSLSGIDTFNSTVPDPTLSLADRYGISLRPRQSMFVDRLTAVKEMITYVNSVFAVNPVAKEFNLTQMLAEEPPPVVSTGVYDYALGRLVPIGQSVAVDSDLAYLDANILPTGYKVLVLDDTTQDDLWVIYQLSAVKTWEIYRVQSYKTKLYWEYADWYYTGYDATTKPTFAVETTVDALKLGAVAGSIIKINNATGDGTWQLVVVNSDKTFTPVGIQNGTIQLNSSLSNYIDNQLGFDNQEFDTNRYDQNPNLELRSIIAALRDDIFVNTLQGKFNDLFFVMINYLFTEQKYVDWIFKSSFISVLHKLRTLSQFPSYVQDNQTYYQSYIDEVKPYRTKVREYLIDYTGSDSFDGTVTDFDLPAFYDTTLGTGIFRSPSGEDGYADSDLALWQMFPYNQWYNNRNLEIGYIVVDNTGYGYTIPPVVTILTSQGKPTTATAIAILDPTTGSVVSIKVTNPGKGFALTPQVILTGSNVIPAVAYAVLVNPQVRSISTKLKFDRITYTSRIQTWQPNTQYNQGDIVTYAQLQGNNYIRNSYVVNTDMVTGSTFLASDYTMYAADLFTNANDRILGYYQPSLTMPSVEVTSIPLVVANTASNTNTIYVFNGSGLFADMNVTGPSVTPAYITKVISTVAFGNSSVTQVTLSANVTLSSNTGITATYNGLGQLIPGIEYPGVQISGLTFDQQPGYSTLRFDNGVFDNLQYDADGTPVIGDDVIDNIIQSSYTDSALGTRAEDINVVGGSYVDTYSSHAPEELIPGIVFDTLDIKVYTQINNGTQVLGYRIFNNMLRNTTYLRISDSYTTVLSNVLLSTDTQIFVSNSSALPVPDVTSAYPGVVFIGAERITYWTNDTVNNVLGQIRRGTEGTSVGNSYPVATLVTDASHLNIIPGTVTGNVTPTHDTAYQTSDTVSYLIGLSGNVTAKIGDVISQGSTGASATVLGAVATNTNTLLVQYNSTTVFRSAEVLVTLTANISANVGDTVAQSLSGANLTVKTAAVNTNQLTLIYNNAFSLVIGFGNVTVNGQDANTRPVISTITTIETPIAINGVLSANVYPLNVAIQGLVNGAGQVTIAANTFLSTSKVWYNVGAGVATDGTGFEGAITEPVAFLKAKLATINSEYTGPSQIGTEDGLNTLLTEDGNDEIYGG